MTTREHWELLERMVDEAYDKWERGRGARATEKSWFLR
jgi:hypothetical protein